MAEEKTNLTTTTLTQKTTNTESTQVKDVEPEKKEIHISEEVDAKLEAIQKNIDYCEEHGCPDALKEGGKWYKAFNTLVDTTVSLEARELEKILKPMLPGKEDEILALIKGVITASKEPLMDLTRKSDIDGIKKLIKKCKKIYADNYVEKTLARYN